MKMFQRPRLDTLQQINSSPLHRCPIYLNDFGLQWQASSVQIACFPRRQSCGFVKNINEDHVRECVGYIWCSSVCYRELVGVQERFGIIFSFNGLKLEIPFPDCGKHCHTFFACDFHPLQNHFPGKINRLACATALLQVINRSSTIIDPIGSTSKKQY